MTIHKAKGLQKEVVILPWMDFTPLHPGGYKHCTFNGDDDLSLAGHGEVRAITTVNSGMDDWDDRTLADYREALHLLYVATTRAKSEMYLFAPKPPEKRPPRFLIMLDELLDGLRENSENAPPMPPCRQEETDNGVIRQWGEKVMPEQKAEQEKEKYEIPSSQKDGPHKDPLPGSGRKLNVYGANVDDLDWWSPRKMGTFIHHCMEYLRFSNRGAAHDAMEAVERGAHTFPLPIPDRVTVLRETAEIIEWFASLPEARTWIENGKPEQALLNMPDGQKDGKRGIRRIDLLVEEEDRYTAVEYKTNAKDRLPRKAHVKQLKEYLDLLNQTKRKKNPARGVLVYLDKQKFFRIPEEGQA